MMHLTAATVSSWATLALQEGAVEGVLGAEGGAAPGAPGGAGGPGGAAAPPAGGFGLMMPLLFLMVGFLFISTILGGRKEKKRRAEMLGGLQKRDRVQTVGGVIGTIIEIKGDEFLLESDRASNTRLWVTRSSVSNVLRSAGAPASDAAAPSDKTTEAAGV